MNLDDNNVIIYDGDGYLKVAFSKKEASIKFKIPELKEEVNLHVKKGVMYVPILTNEVFYDGRMHYVFYYFMFQHVSHLITTLRIYTPKAMYKIPYRDFVQYGVIEPLSKSLDKKIFLSKMLLSSYKTANFE